ncbi:MAG: hypothetical protein Q7Q73_19180 [Verrucomicrobiota bacterium JB024]|nr:hypothetical protein [Verrucomicrobiota bacterium JB024]
MPRKSPQQKDAENRGTGSLVISLVLAVLCVAIGFLAGVVHLALIPVQTVRAMPKETEPHTVYYVQNTSGAAPSYKTKQTALVDAQGGTVSVSTAELNTWAADTFRFAKMPGEQEGGLVLIPSAPKFNISDGTLNMAVMMEVKTYGKSHKVLFQTQGTFAQGAAGVEFVPEESYLGSAKLPREVVTPLVSDFIYRIFTRAEAADPVVDAWNELSDVRIEGNALTLTKG